VRPNNCFAIIAISSIEKRRSAFKIQAPGRLKKSPSRERQGETRLRKACVAC